MIYVGKLNEDMWVSKGQYQQACNKNTKLEFMPSDTRVPTAHILIVISIFIIIIINMTNIVYRPLLLAERLRVAHHPSHLQAVYPLVAHLQFLSPRVLLRQLTSLSTRISLSKSLILIKLLLMSGILVESLASLAFSMHIRHMLKSKMPKMPLRT